jgi:hypothetical protein
LHVCRSLVGGMLPYVLKFVSVSMSQTNKWFYLLFSINSEQHGSYEDRSDMYTINNRGKLDIIRKVDGYSNTMVNYV